MVANICTKANRTLGFLKRKLYSYPQEVKAAAYKGLCQRTGASCPGEWYM